MSSLRTSKVIGANLSFSLLQDQDSFKFEFLINQKSQLEDFSINSSNEDVRLTCVNIFQSLLRVDFTKLKFHEVLKDFEKEHEQTLCLLWRALEKFNNFINPYATTTEDTINLCRCFGVTKTEVLQTIENGASDILTVTNLTRAGGACGSCVNDISNLLPYKESDDLNNYELLKGHRSEIEGLYPVQYLKQIVFPLVDQLNKEMNTDLEVVQLIENHLYVRVSCSASKVEELLADKLAKELVILFV